MKESRTIPRRRAVNLADGVEAVRKYVADAGLMAGDRLPPERELAPRLGMARGRLRAALELMVRGGEIWRHVGKGTFLSETRPSIGLIEDVLPPPFNLTNPIELLTARLVVEPKLAAMAALHGTPRQLAAIQEWQARGEAATDYAASQLVGDGWHRSVAEAAQNELLLWVFKQLFAVRNHLNLGRLSPAAHGDGYVAVMREHAVITEAICARYAAEAERLMRQHLEALRRRIESLI